MDFLNKKVYKANGVGLSYSYISVNLKRGFFYELIADEITTYGFHHFAIYNKEGVRTGDNYFLLKHMVRVFEIDVRSSIYEEEVK